MWYGGSQDGGHWEIGYASSMAEGEFQPDQYTVALYHFNEGSGTTVYDATTNENNGTIHGATWTANGKFGNALYFDGNHRYVEILSPPDLGNVFTIDAWVKIMAATPTNPRIFSRYNNYEINLSLFNRKFSFYVPHASNAQIIYSITPFDDFMNQWVLEIGRAHV